MDPEDYVADLLYKVMPRIMNPKGWYYNNFVCHHVFPFFVGKYGFYSNPNNRADWFPEKLPFKSPNHPKSNVSIREYYFNCACIVHACMVKEVRRSTQQKK